MTLDGLFAASFVGLRAAVSAGVVLADALGAVLSIPVVGFPFAVIGAAVGAALTRSLQLGLSRKAPLPTLW